MLDGSQLFCLEDRRLRHRVRHEILSRNMPNLRVGVSDKPHELLAVNQLTCVVDSACCQVLGYYLLQFCRHSGFLLQLQIIYRRSSHWSAAQCVRVRYLTLPPCKSLEGHCGVVRVCLADNILSIISRLMVYPNYDKLQ